MKAADGSTLKLAVRELLLYPVSTTKNDLVLGRIQYRRAIILS